MLGKAKIILQILKRVAILGDIRKELRALKCVMEKHDALYRKRQKLFDRINKDVITQANKESGANRRLYKHNMQLYAANLKLRKENLKLQQKQLKQGGRK